MARAAGYASVAAGVAIWVVGEGVGGVFTGTAALSTGAPGAALLYSLLTVLAWPRPADGGEEPLSASALHRSWTAIWLLGAVLVFVPAQWGRAGSARRRQWADDVAALDGRGHVGARNLARRAPDPRSGRHLGDHVRRTRDCRAGATLPCFGKGPGGSRRPACHRRTYRRRIDRFRRG